MGTAFFPLDDELNLPDTTLLPHAHQSLVRLASKMPFEQATSDLAAILGIQISASTTRRQTLQTGRAVEEVRTLQAQTHAGSPSFPIPREEPVERLAMGSDGGMVPLRKGVWAEVKTVVIAQVCSETRKNKEAITTKHSYFSRLADAETFADLASAEIARRSVAEAKEVCAIQDGALWLQGFVDGHRSDAVRILDFAHAAEYLGKIAQEGREAGYHVPACWLSVLLHQLKHHGPKRLMEHINWWKHHRCSPAVLDAWRYFGKRQALMDYPRFQAQGWPIGSGMVESANKAVMQARLKGAGMHWEASNVNPMLALRNELYNDRWQEGWEQHQQQRKEHHHIQRQQRAQQRRAHLLQKLKEQVVRWYLLMPVPKQVPPPLQPKGRTEGQKRWGRQTFSHKARFEVSAKK